MNRAGRPARFRTMPSTAARFAAPLAGRRPGIAGYGENRLAAVIAPLVETGEGLSLLFQVRARHLKSQPGEVAFPGGKVEPGESPEAAALRETREELCLPESAVRLLAPLDLLVLPFNMVIHPFLGEIADPALVHPNPAECDEVFTVPWALLAATPPGVASARILVEAGSEFPTRLFPGEGPYGFREGRYPVLYYEVRGRTIWGITARIVKSLVDLVTAASQASGIM